jgi:hypothetical protein
MIADSNEPPLEGYPQRAANFLPPHPGLGQGTG